MKQVTKPYTVIMALVFVTSCSTNTVKIKNENLVSYEIDHGEYIDTKNGLNKSEVKTIEALRAYHCHTNVGFSKPKLIKNTWVLKETFNRKPWELWISNDSGTIIKGACTKNPLSLSDLIHKRKSMKKLPNGVFEIKPKVVISNSDGIQYNEAERITQMYSAISYPHSNTMYSSPKNNVGYWESTHVGHWTFKKLRNTVRISKINGNLSHGNKKMSLINMVVEYKKIQNKRYKQCMQSFGKPDICSHLK